MTNSIGALFLLNQQIDVRKQMILIKYLVNDEQNVDFKNLLLYI
jgi:hypothetical protein